jgi:hypothetical protein
MTAPTSGTGTSMGAGTGLAAAGSGNASDVAASTYVAQGTTLSGSAAVAAASAAALAAEGGGGVTTEDGSRLGSLAIVGESCASLRVEGVSMLRRTEEEVGTAWSV